VAAATGKPVAAEMMDLVFSEGRVVTMIEGSVPLFDAEGRVRGSVTAGVDVTLLRRAEEALRISEARFHRLIEVAPLPLCLVDGKGTLTYFNDRFVQVFGYTHDDIPTLREWWQQAHPDPEYRQWVVETWEAAVKKAAEEKTDIEPTEYRVTCKDGRVRIVEISGITIEDGFLATFIDVTARRKTEDEIRRFAEELRAGNEELARLNRAMVGRELRMIDLKKEINALCAQAAQPLRYPLEFEKEQP
jgi:PAS domain S-box-containing protein